MRYLGIDYGSKKIGLALSDEDGTMGFPHSIIPNTPRVLALILALVQEQNVGAAVIGESKDFTGRDNPIAEAARAFAEALHKEANIPVYFEPETLTTAEARRARDATNVGRAPKDTSAVDASAAALILTSYLSRHHA